MVRWNGEQRRFGRGAAVALASALAVLAPIGARAQDGRPTSGERARAVATLGFEIRLGLSRAPQGLTLVFRGPDRAALGPLATLADGADAFWLQRFIGQTQQIVSATDDGAVLIWWNPFADEGVVTRWRLETDGWRIAGAGAVLGDDLEPSAPGAAAAGQSLAEQLDLRGRHRLDTLRAAVTNGQLQACLDNPKLQARAWKALIGREERLTATLLPPKDSSVASLRAQTRWFSGLIQKASLSTAPDPALARDLSLMTPATRADFQPVMRLQGPGGDTVLLQSPQAGGLVLLAHLQARPDGKGRGAIWLQPVHLSPLGPKELAQ